MSTEKEAFVPPEERPHVGIQPDTPLSELRVRDLRELLGAPIPSKNLALDFINAKHIKDLNDLAPMKDFTAEVTHFPGYQGDPIVQLVKELTGLREQVAELDKKVRELTEQRR